MNRRIWTRHVTTATLLAAIAAGCGMVAGTNDQSTTQLHQAVENGDLAGLQSLLQSGTDVNVTDGKGQTPLHVAARQDDVEVILLLVDYGADLFARDKQNFTPRAVAGAYGKQEAEEALLELEDHL